MLKIENARLRNQVLACKCKRRLKPKNTRAFKRTTGLAYRPSLTARLMPGRCNTVSADKLNSLIQRVKERANQQKKKKDFRLYIPLPILNIKKEKVKTIECNSNGHD